MITKARQLKISERANFLVEKQIVQNKRLRFFFQLKITNMVFI